MANIEASAALRVENARMIDGTGAEPLPNAVIVADESGRIQYAGPAASAPPRVPGVQVVDAGGRTVLPGFFDCHVHLGLPDDKQNFLIARLVEDPLLTSLRSTQVLKKTLDSGVTTARDLCGLPVAFRTAIEQGVIEGPRLHVAITSLSHTGGHGDSMLPSGLAPFTDGALTPFSDACTLVDTVDEARVATRRLLRDGADVIKVHATGGMASRGDDPDDEGLTEEEIAAVIDEARRHRGRPVAAHAQGLAGIRAAVRGGVTSIEHGYAIDAECVDLLGERGGFLVPTLSTLYLGVDKKKMSEWHYQKRMRWASITKENIAAAIARKAPIALGTDSPVAPFGESLKELTFLVDLGMAPMDAIIAGTRSSARLLGLADDLGTLEKGKLADLIVCSGDPLGDITVLGDAANVVLVAQQGVIRKNLLSHDAVTTPIASA
ncbi:hydrolase [Acrocarpospora pleiomorpha]|uniref:Hydrolase n=2 Tax=Acrocarpospora pleiomorpha TaxID=90975 RepID=A0A5M3XGX6_9ACTN|nr:hydrolase [Acrocarpospora pleiomorpha]